MISIKHKIYGIYFLHSTMYVQNLTKIIELEQYKIFYSHKYLIVTFYDVYTKLNNKILQYNNLNCTFKLET